MLLSFFKSLQVIDESILHLEMRMVLDMDVPPKYDWRAKYCSRLNHVIKLLRYLLIRQSVGATYGEGERGVEFTLHLASWHTHSLARVR